MLVDATMSAHVVKTTSELSAFIKGGAMAANSERDAGFCSGGDEDDNMSGLHSPSASEDSVEVQITPISLRNKRKLAEPRKIQEPNMAPLKKRRFELIERNSTMECVKMSSSNSSSSSRSSSSSSSSSSRCSGSSNSESCVAVVAIQDEESRPIGSPSPSPFRPWSSPTAIKSFNNGNNNNNNSSNRNNNDSSGSENNANSNSGKNDGNETDGSPGNNILADPEESQDGIGAAKQVPVIRRRYDEDRWNEEENRRREEETRRQYEARIQEEVLTRLQESDNRRHRQHPPHHHHHHHRHNHTHHQPHEQHHHCHQRPMSPISPQLFTALPRPSAINPSSGSNDQRREHRSKQKIETTRETAANLLPNSRLQDEPLSLVLKGETSRVPAHPGVNGSYEGASLANFDSEAPHLSHHHNGHRNSAHSCNRSNAGHSEAQHQQQQRQQHQQQQHQQQEQKQHLQQQQQLQQQQRNYKNMTRERRIEANARERTRVHTISAAFDTLRRAVPAYSNNQKLSKLSVLRIACSYIMTLSNIANTPEGEPTISASLGACVDLVSRTIQTEGKLRKKKDE